MSKQLKVENSLSNLCCELSRGNFFSKVFSYLSYFAFGSVSSLLYRYWALRSSRINLLTATSLRYLSVEWVVIFVAWTKCLLSDSTRSSINRHRQQSQPTVAFLQSNPWIPTRLFLFSRGRHFSHRLNPEW